MLEDLIKEELVKSMKERDILRVSTLRMINASIKDLEISRRPSNSNQIKDEDIIQILSKMIKQRREAAVTFEKGGRKDLQDKENGRKINPDKLLCDLLKVTPDVNLTYFNLQRYMSPHFAKNVKKTAPSS